MKTITNTGTQLKLALVPQCGNLTGDDFDFTATFRTFLGSHAETIKKDDMTFSDGAYIAIVDTKWMTPGELVCTLEAVIPDSDAPSGERREITMIHTGIEIRRTL